MDVKVGDKKFKLEKKSIYISELYSELTKMAFDKVDLGAEVDEIDLEYQSDIEDGMSNAKAGLKRIRAIRHLRSKIDALTGEIFEKRFEVLAEVLDLNGYEFDADLWRKKADVETVNDILVDLVGTGSKKKEK